MSSLRPQDRKSLCRFTFADGRQCHSPHSPHHPHFCSDHARKDSQACADKLARELSYFFSGQYLSACDLGAALGRLLPAVVRGDIKPRSARTLAYLSQTLAQTIHLAEDEHINAFGTDAWRQAVRNSVHQNFDFRHPSPPPEPPLGQPPHVVAGLSRSVRPGSTGKTGPGQAPQPSPTPQPAPPPHTPLPPTSTEFIHHVVAGLQTGGGQAPQPAPQPATAPHTPLPPTGTEFIQHVVAGLQTGEKSSLP